MAPSGTHENGTADVAFGTLAKTNGAAPTWNGTSLGCAASYCHGGTMAGGTRTTPIWSLVDGTQVACTACHGMPPATVAKGARTHPQSSGTDCGNCHTGYTAAKVNVALHVNGTVDATFSCTSCHGDATRVLVTGADAQTASSPPVNAAGTAWSTFGVGAHLAHLNKGTGAIGAHVACSECHTVYAAAPTGGTDKHGNGVAEVVFGTRAKTGGAVPTYNAGSATVAPSCATSYCHGNFTVNANSHGVLAANISWNTAGPLACKSCHTVNASNVPVPNDSCHPPNFNHDGGNSCSSCHKNVNSAGTAITDATTHVDGTINGKCTDCHRGNTKVCQ
jgi:predicted CxxxxCH...CXXCH cytochrome family protein